MKLNYILMILLSLVSTKSFSDSYGNLFAPEIEVAETSLELKGISKLTVRLFFDVYVAAFYQPDESGPSEVLTDEPYHLEIYYLRSITKQAFLDAADDMLSSQHSPEVIAGIQNKIDQINQLYDNVQKGDRYSLTYLPGSGTELKRNGIAQGVIPGADFARIYFSIWLGEKCPYREFRDRLVGLP